MYKSISNNVRKAASYEVVRKSFQEKNIVKE